MTPKVRKSVKVSGWRKSHVIIVAISLICTIITTGFSVQSFYQVKDLNEKNYELDKQVLNLTEQVHNLTTRIYEIENPKPTIEILEIEYIEIGPSPPFWNQYDNRVTFEYDGTMNLEIEVLISTTHNGKFVVSNEYLHLEWDNTTDMYYGFTGDVTRDTDYIYPIEPSTEIILINFSFNMYYKFTDSPILQESNYELATFHFSLEFQDLQTSSIEYSNNLNAEIVWNNQTQLT